MFEALKPSNKSCTRILTLRIAIHDICFQFRYISCTHFLQLSFLSACNTQHAFFITSQPPETENFTSRSTWNRITMAESEDCFLLLLQNSKFQATFLSQKNYGNKSEAKNKLKNHNPKNKQRLFRRILIECRLCFETCRINFHALL